MMTRDEWHKTWAAGKEDAKLERQGRELTMMTQAAIDMKIMTGYTEWDKYLSYLQEFVNQTKAKQAEFERTLNDPMLVDHGPMLQAKIAARECAAVVTALTGAMELPVDIINNGDKAKGLIERMAEKDEAA